jgi:hypothetical protein
VESYGWVIDPFQEPMIDYVTATSLNLETIGFVELQREHTRVGENNFLVKREC